MDNKRVLITGATGLVGSHLAAELITRGFDNITLVLRNSSRLERMIATLDREQIDYSDVIFNIIKTDLTNPVELKAAFEDIDVVYNCAAAVSLGAMDENVLIEGNMQITRHVVNACLDAGVGKLIHVSSIAAIGEAPENVKYIDETMTHESIAGLPGYYAGKLLSENEVMRGVASGLKAVIVNPALILGAGDWRTGSTALIASIANGEPFYTDGVTGIVDVKDVVRAMVELADCDEALGERYILCGANISYRELLTLAARAANKKPPHIRAGKFLLGVAWRTAAFWGALTGTRLLFSRELAEVLQKKTYYSTEKIKNTLNFEFTPVEETINRVVKQYLTERDVR